MSILCAPTQYGSYLQELRQHRGETSLAFRQACAHQGFLQTAAYDRAIATYFSTQATAATPGPELAVTPPLPAQLMLVGQQHQPLRYGENPHQIAVWYQTGATPTGWTAATQLQGKELSYNNLVDLEAARRLIAEFAGADSVPTVAILKHTNPCGVAQAATLQQAYGSALNADPVSAFGGIVALNRSIDPPTASALTQTFWSVSLPPTVNPKPRKFLAASPRCES